MHIMKSAAYLVIAGALAVGTATEASAQQIPRGGKDAPVPVRPDTVIITRRDTVTVFRRDTLTVTRWDTVRVEVAPPVYVPPAFYWGPEVGATIPFLNLSRGHHAGWHVGLLAGWQPAASAFGFQVEGVYHKLAELSESANLAGDATLMNVNADIKLGVPLFQEFLGGARMYAVAGPSFFYSKNLRWSTKDRPTEFYVDDERCTLASCPQDDNFNADFGWNAGLGLQVANRVTVESKFHHMLGDGSRYFITPISFALTF
jgi:hypothetical protein